MLLSLAFRVAVLTVAVFALAFAGFALAFSSATFLFFPCPRLLVLGSSLMPNAFSPRMGVSGDNEEYCVNRYCTKSLYVRVETLVFVNFHVPMGMSNCGQCWREFSSQCILAISLI